MSSESSRIMTRARERQNLSRDVEGREIAMRYAAMPTVLQETPNATNICNMRRTSANMRCRAVAMPCRCHADAVPLPCRVHAPCRCHAPCRRHAAMPLPVALRHAVATPMPCRHAHAMPSPCRHAVARCHAPCLCRAVAARCRRGAVVMEGPLPLSRRCREKICVVFGH